MEDRKLGLMASAVREIRAQVAVSAESLAKHFRVGLTYLSQELRPAAGAGIIELVRLGKDSYYRLAPEVGLLLGVDLKPEGGEVAVSYCNFDRIAREPLSPMRESLGERNVSSVLDEVAERLNKAMERVHGDYDQVLGVGVALPAPVSRETRRPAAHFILPGWEEHDIAAELAARLQGPTVVVGNDASLGALGLFTRLRLNNPATAPEDLLYVKLSDGIGSGVVLKGHLVGGGAGYAGELGHLKVASSGPLCTRCGGIGCLEVLAGAGAVRARIAAATGRRNANLTELLGHDHPAVGQAVHSAAWHVGTALSHAVTLINPSWVILDGDLAVHAEFRNTVEHALERQALPSSAKAVQIQTLDQLRASWGSSPLWNGREELSPVVLGALAHVVDELGDAYLDVRLSSL